MTHEDMKISFVELVDEMGRHLEYVSIEHSNFHNGDYLKINGFSYLVKRVTVVVDEIGSCSIEVIAHRSL